MISFRISGGISWLLVRGFSVLGGLASFSVILNLLLWERGLGEVGALAFEGAGGGEELVDHAAVARLQAPLLGRCQVVGHGKGRQILQGPANAFELFFELGEARGERRGLCGIAAGDPQRRSQQLAAFALAGGAVGVKQRQRFAGLEAVLLAGREHGLLVLGRQRAKRVRERGPDRSAPQPLLDRGREARAQGETRGDPSGLAPEQPPYGRDGQAILGPQRADDARLVERGQGPWGRVGQEQQALVLLCALRAFDHDRHERGACLAPALQALESI
jgi:hypothetical protein